MKMLPDNTIDSSCSNPHEYAGICSCCFLIPGASVQSNDRDRIHCCRIQHRIAKMTLQAGWRGLWSLCHCRGIPGDTSLALSLPLMLYLLPWRVREKKAAHAKASLFHWPLVLMSSQPVAIVRVFDNSTVCKEVWYCRLRISTIGRIFRSAGTSRSVCANQIKQVLALLQQ